MHATIHRFQGTSDADDDILQAVNHLAAILSKKAGFVSFAWLDAGDRVGRSITIFETQAELVEAGAMIDAWAGKYLARWLAEPLRCCHGEVIAQMGM